MANERGQSTIKVVFDVENAEAISDALLGNVSIIQQASDLMAMSLERSLGVMEEFERVLTRVSDKYATMTGGGAGSRQPRPITGLPAGYELSDAEKEFLRAFGVKSKDDIDKAIANALKEQARLTREYGEVAAEVSQEIVDAKRKEWESVIRGAEARAEAEEKANDAALKARRELEKEQQRIDREEQKRLAQRRKDVQTAFAAEDAAFKERIRQQMLLLNLGEQTHAQTIQALNQELLALQEQVDLQGQQVYLLERMNTIRQQIARIENAQRFQNDPAAGFNIVGRNQSQADFFSIQLARMTQDAMMFHQSIAAGLMSIVNNMDMAYVSWKELSSGPGGMREGWEQIRRSLTGPMGIVLGLNAAVTAFMLLEPLARSFAGDMEKARQEAERLRDIRLEGFAGAFDLSGKSLEELAQYLENVTTKEREYNQILEDRRSKLFEIARQYAGRDLATFSDEDLERIGQLNEDIVRYEELLAEVERIETDIESEQQRRTGETRADLFSAVFGVSTEDAEEALRIISDFAFRRAEILANADEDNIEARRKAAERQLVEELRALEEREKYLIAKYAETNNVLFSMAAQAVQDEANLILTNWNKLVENLVSKDERRKGPTPEELARQLEDMIIGTERAQVQARRQGLEERLRILEIEEREAVLSLERQLEDYKGTGQQRVEFEEQVQKQIAAVRERYAREAQDLARSNAIREGQARMNAEFELQEARANLLRGTLREDEIARIQHERRMSELRFQMAQEEDQAQIDRLLSLIELENQLYEQQSNDRKARREQERQEWEREMAIMAQMSVYDSQILSLREDSVQKRRNRYRNEQAIDQIDTDRQIFDLSVQLQEDLIEQQRLLDEKLISEEDYYNRSLALVAQYEEDKRLIEEGARIRQLEAEKEHSRTLHSLIYNSAAQITESISQIYDASFDMWANKRRQELIDMGYTEQQANKIIDEEGKKRFRIKKAIAYAETVVSTFAAAQQAYASQMALATPDAPIRAKIAAATAIAAGLARAAAIKAQQIGGGGGGVGAPGAPTGNYGVQTTGGGTIGMSIRQGASDSLVTSSSVRRDSAELASLREEVSSMRVEMVDATRSLASRPNEIVITPSTSGALVRIGSDANANRAR